MRTHSTTRRALFAALLSSVLPGSIFAQTFALTSTAPVRVDPIRAEHLHARASNMADGTQALTSGSVRRLSELHIQAAELFALSDPQGIECLKHAANLLHRHDPARAARLQEMAADRALASGDVLQAAHGYIDVAAFVQRSFGAGAFDAEEWTPRVKELARRAELLASSPLLADTDRAAIRARIR